MKLQHLQKYTSFTIKSPGEMLFIALIRNIIRKVDSILKIP